jgi:Amt family ammonium transporter
LIGLLAGIICFVMCTNVKNWFGYDDSLDVFGVHGIGGIVGALLTGVFASSALGGSIADLNIGSQLMKQAAGVGATLVWSGVLTFVIIKVVDGMIGIRVSDEEETTGLDLSLHNEQGFNL